MKKRFPIVALGASAGGLEAFAAFFEAMPPDADIAFVVVAHLDPGHVSLLPDLIQKHTAMRVQQVQDGAAVEPNCIYVIPPNKNLSIRDKTLFLTAIDKSRGINLPIDSFFASLAEDQTDNAIGIVLSGTGSDGTQGLKAIKSENGMVMVQREDSAKYDGMPKNAIATGMADFILPADQMPNRLIGYVDHAFVEQATKTAGISGQQLPDALHKIYSILLARTGHDFSQYKKTTIYRRIERRMHVHQIKQVQEYVDYLKKSEREVEILFKALLIGVTSFFRDPGAFDVLKSEFLPNLLENKPDDHTVRVWVSGCSTGEEAYSLAILLKEYMSENDRHFNVQIFATDIDEDAIERARAGLFPDSILADVSPERLKRYFNRETDGWFCIKKSIRELLVFAPQSVIKDPPFTKLDLLSCRNLLIYLEPGVQKKLVSIFHYSLNPGGILFLGSSESIGPADRMFSTLNKKAKLFEKQFAGNQDQPLLTISPTPEITEESEIRGSKNMKDFEELGTLRLVETILKESNTPPCAIIDDSNDVIYIHGRTGLFLEPAEGKISVNILEMAKPGLMPALSENIKKVALHKQEVTTRGLKVEQPNGATYLDLTIKPIDAQYQLRGLMMVIFDEKKDPPSAKAKKTTATGKRPRRSVPDLERELIQTRQSLQTTIEELQTSNEELKSSNEELQSTNEELQSTNEEMETSKEELQSLNEESATVNAELQSRIEELSKTNDDMKNLLDSTNIATIFLDTDLCIRRYTPRSTDIVPLTSADIGRPIKHLVTSLADTDISLQGNQVLKDLIPRETEVHSGDGHSYAMKIRPYRTMQNIIDGVVVTFEDISTQKDAEYIVQESEAKYRMLFELASDSIVLFEGDSGKVCECNETSYADLGYTRDEFLQLKISDIEQVNEKPSLTSSIEWLNTKGSDSFVANLRGKIGDVVRVQVKAKSILFKEKKYTLTTWRAVDGG